MFYRRLLVCLMLFFLFSTFLPRVNLVIASSPKKIDATFYKDICTSSGEEIVIIKFTEKNAVTFSKSNQIAANSPLTIDNTYTQKLFDRQMDWVSNSKQMFPFTLLNTYQLVFNGIAIQLRGYNIRYLLNDPRIDFISDTRSLNYLYREYSVNSISAKPVWNLLDSNKIKITGKGVKIGVLDSGLDYYHPDFLDAEGIASRVKGGYDFADGDEDFYDSGANPEKIPGIVPHGTHVSGAILGNNLSNPLKKGMAPDADLYVYKVFSDLSSRGNVNKIMAGIERSVKDKCQVINMSLGNQNPTPSQDPNDPYYQSVLNATKAGVVVVCAAGNDGSRNSRQPYTVHAPGTYEPVIQVAGSDDRMNVSVQVNYADSTKQMINCRKFTYTPPFLPNLNGLEIVDCGFGRPEDFVNIDVKGKVAFISRGPREKGISFQDKNLNSKKAGALAAITYNYDEGSLMGTLVMQNSEISPYDYNFIPDLQMSGIGAYYVKKALENGGEVLFPNNLNVSMYDMSSIGPCFSGGDNIFKPEISAPGKQINSSVMSGRDKDNKAIAKYEDWDGTSMATPHVTGAIALICQAHPQWNPADIKSVVMNSADIIKNQMSELPFSFFMQGSGQINTLSAIQAPMITSPPSLMRSIAKLEDSYFFEIKNVSKSDISVNTSFEIFGETTDSNPVLATFTNQSMTIAKADKKKFSISFMIDETKFLNRSYEGVIWIQSENTTHHIPVILYKGRITDTDNPITNFRISENSLDMKNPIPATITFDINMGSHLVVKGIDPEMDTNSNYAENFRIYVTDAKKNIWGTIFFAENIFVGKYSFIWNGLDVYGNEIVPNGNYFLMAEISGVKVTIETGKDPVREQIPETSDLLSVLIQESSIPTPPMLLLSCPDKIEINKEFVLEIIFADSQDIDEVQFKLTWSKSSVSSVSYSIGDFVDTERIDEKKDIQLADGIFVIIAKRDPATFSKSRLKVATIRLVADKTTTKTGLMSTFDLIKIKDKAGNNRKTNLNYPNIQIVKNFLEYGDFNNDGFIDKADLVLLLAAYQKTYLDADWDPNFDLNNDLTIDIADFVIFSKYYGED